MEEVLKSLLADESGSGSIFRTRLKEYGSGLYRVNQSREYNLREWVTQIGDYGQTTPFTGTYTYFDDGNVETAAFNQIDAPSPDHFKFNLSYDPIHRLTSGNYYSGYWDIDCDSGAFQARGGSKRKKPIQGGGGVLFAEEGCWLYSGSTNYDLSGITYDNASNILTLNRNNASGTEIDDLAYTISGTSNRMTAIADDHDSTAETWDAEDGSFTYDLNGNIETMGAPYSITATTFDHRNLALSMTTSGTSTLYRYNEGGQRLWKKEGTNASEFYVLDGATTVGVFSTSGTPDYWNITLGGMVLGRVDANGDRFYYEKDHLGTVRRVLDESGSTTEWYDYDPWGALMRSSTVGTKDGYTGKERDTETGLDYFGARYYMPAFARWTSVDPLAEKHPEWSPYNYVLDNPMTLIDPDGKQIRADATDWNVDSANGPWRRDDQGRLQMNWPKVKAEGSVAIGALAAIGLAEAAPLVVAATYQLGPNGGGVLKELGDFAMSFVTDAPDPDGGLGSLGQASRRLTGVSDIFESVENLGRLPKGQIRGELIGNAENIFASLVKDAEKLKSGAYRLQNGNFVNLHISQTTDFPTISVNTGEEIFKIRIIKKQ